MRDHQDFGHLSWTSNEVVGFFVKWHLAAKIAAGSRSHEGEMFYGLQPSVFSLNT
jgi:hypothetical protein